MFNRDMFIFPVGVETMMVFLWHMEHTTLISCFVGERGKIEAAYDAGFLGILVTHNEFRVSTGDSFGKMREVLSQVWHAGKVRHSS